MTSPALLVSAPAQPAEPLPIAAALASGQLGEVFVDPKHLIAFPDGIPGFETCKSFALIWSDETAPFHCLHAVGGANASFLTVNPAAALPSFQCTLSAADRTRLGECAESELVWLAIVSIGEDGTVAANLRAPIVINPATMTGFQVLPHQAVYSLRHVITELP